MCWLSWLWRISAQQACRGDATDIKKICMWVPLAVPGALTPVWPHSIDLDYIWHRPIIASANYGISLLYMASAYHRTSLLHTLLSTLVAVAYQPASPSQSFPLNTTLLLREPPGPKVIREPVATLWRPMDRWPTQQSPIWGTASTRTVALAPHFLHPPLLFVAPVHCVDDVGAVRKVDLPDGAAHHVAGVERRQRDPGQLAWAWHGVRDAAGMERHGVGYTRMALCGDTAGMKRHGAG